MSNYRLALGIALIFFVVVAEAYDLEKGKKSPPPLKKKLPPPPPSTPKKPPPPPRSPPRKKSPPPSPSLPPPPPVTPFDFFMLAQTWPASFCLEEKCISQPSKFVIHGLWPQNRFGDNPHDCDPKSNIAWNRFAPLQMALKDDWPCLTSTKRESELGFWTHEWQKHGTCSMSLLDSYDYFSEALKIYKGNKLKDILQKKGISPGPKSVESIKIINAISEHIGGFKPQIMCTQYQNKCYLLGIGVCLDKSKDFPYKDCRGSTSIRCEQQVYYP